jgi:hypothetical protein
VVQHHEPCLGHPQYVGRASYGPALCEWIVGVPDRDDSVALASFKRTLDAVEKAVTFFNLVLAVAGDGVALFADKDRAFLVIQNAASWLDEQDQGDRGIYKEIAGLVLFPDFSEPEHGRDLIFIETDTVHDLPSGDFEFDVFISYKHRAYAEEAERLAAELKERGLSVGWIENGCHCPPKAGFSAPSPCRCYRRCGVTCRSATWIRHFWLTEPGGGLLSYRSMREPIDPHRILRDAVLRVEHRPAGVAKLRRVLPQASDNPVHVGNFRAAQPKHIRRASQLLFDGATIIIGPSGRLRDQ